MQQLLDNIVEIGNNSVIKILLIILGAIITQVVLKAALRNAVKLSLKSNAFPNQKADREKRIRTLDSIIGATTSFVVWFIAILMIMGIMNIPIAPLLTSAGLIGAALAFGTQSIIRDFISGVFIIIENQYRVGDYIELDKVSGQVEAITVRTTILRSEDGYLHHVPNGLIGITTNQSIGPVKAQEQIDLAASITIDDFSAKLSKIAETIQKDPDMQKLIKDGPHLSSVIKVTASTTTVSISFTTSANKRQAASSTIWQLIKQSHIPLI